MLVRRLNMAWKSGHPNQCLRLGYDAKTDRTLRARFRESASYSSPLSVSSKPRIPERDRSWQVSDPTACRESKSTDTADDNRSLSDVLLFLRIATYPSRRGRSNCLFAVSHISRCPVDPAWSVGFATFIGV